MKVYSSSDVQQHLAAQAFTFSSADREFRELMALTKMNPAVLSICLKEGQCSTSCVHTILYVVSMCIASVSSMGQEEKKLAVFIKFI